jgi:hypothetical protein
MSPDANGHGRTGETNTFGSESIVGHVVRPSRIKPLTLAEAAGVNAFYARKEYAALEHFSISKDLETLVPFIKNALKYQPALKLWASSWSPPIWMKYNKHAISRLDTTIYWGEGRTSASDGQRFALPRRILQQTYSTCFSDFALEFYTFLADNYAPFHSMPVECSASSLAPPKITSTAPTATWTASSRPNSCSTTCPSRGSAHASGAGFSRSSSSMHWPGISITGGGDGSTPANCMNQEPDLNPTPAETDSCRSRCDGI